MIETTQFQNHEAVQLSVGASRALFAPQFGARLLTWEIDGEPIVYWPAEADWTNIAHVRGGNPILFPFVARHMVDGVVGKWRDETGVVRDLPMHGFARDMAFAVVEEESGDTLRMRLQSTSATRIMYPFDFTFDVVYQLTANSLAVTFETTNHGDASMPYYPGHHFYFAVPHGNRAAWSLSMPCTRWGWQEPNGAPRFEPAAAQVETLDDARLVDRFNLNFISPQVVLEAPAAHRIVIELLGNAQESGLAPWFDVTTWTQAPESDFFCVEPWLGLPDAIHHGVGLRRLGPSQTERAACRIDVKGA